MVIFHSFLYVYQRVNTWPTRTSGSKLLCPKNDRFVPHFMAIFMGKDDDQRRDIYIYKTRVVRVIYIYTSQLLEVTSIVVPNTPSQNRYHHPFFHGNWKKIRADTTNAPRSMESMIQDVQDVQDVYKKTTHSNFELRPQESDILSEHQWLSHKLDPKVLSQNDFP